MLAVPPVFQHAKISIRSFKTNVISKNVLQDTAQSSAVGLLLLQMAALQTSRLQTRLNGAASRPTRSSRRVAFKAVASSAFEKVSRGLE